jgi:hypothetical protein
MQAGFLMALEGVPVRELFVYVGYWRRTRVPRARPRAESEKKSDSGKTPKVLQVLFRGMSFRYTPRITYQTDRKELS